MRDRAQTVIVGAGIVGASAAYHLAEMGVTDVLVLDQGPLFATGGSTSPRPRDHLPDERLAHDVPDRAGLRRGSTTRSTLDGEPVWYGTGSLEVATTPERVEELKRRQGFARSFGIDGTELLSPGGGGRALAAARPLHDPRRRTGCRATAPARASASSPRSRSGREAAGRRVRGRRPRHRVRRPRRTGDRACGPTRAASRASACCSAPGSGGPTVGAMAGVPDPARRRPAPARLDRSGARARGDRAGPSTRWSATRTCRCTSASARTTTASATTGTSRSSRRRDRSGATARARMPSLMPFTPKDFDLCEAETARLFPALAGRMRPSDPARSINGMFSFTPDAGSIVGESGNVRGVWVCEAVWVTHAAGMARQAVEWMVERRAVLRPGRGRREPLLPVPDDAVLRRRSAAPSSTARSTTSCIRSSSPRHHGTSASRRFYDRQRRSGATFFTGAGWERPQWFEANRDLVGGVTHEWARRAGWAARKWSPIVGGRAPGHARDAPALFDLTPYVKLRVQGPDALVVPGAHLREPDRPAGRHDRLHRDAHAGRRDPLRPHGHAPRGGQFFVVSPAAAPACTTWRGSARRSATARTSGSSTRRRARAAWGSGGRAPATSCSRSPTTTSRTRRSRT